jgi:hypothetical protein
MQHEILTYDEMCLREGGRLQQGMHYRRGPGYSVVLMCSKRSAPYQDRHEGAGRMLVYQGHDAPRSFNLRDPKSADQPEYTSSGRLTENGKFLKAVELYLLGLEPPEPVRVYQKLAPGVWSYNGVHLLTDAWQECENGRQVFRFRLDCPATELGPRPNPRVIPPMVRRAVWKRDQGRCALCGARDNLHFDHIVPFSKGGSSLRSDNVQLLCARHNLRKGAGI